MADNIVDVAKKAQELFVLLKETFSGNTDEAKKYEESIQGVQASYVKAAKEAKNATENQNALNASLKELEKIGASIFFNKFEESLESVIKNVGNTQDKIAGLAGRTLLSLPTAFSRLPTDPFGKMAKSADDAGTSISEMLKTAKAAISSGDSKETGFIGSLLEHLAAGSDRMRAWETNYLNTAASAGQLDDVFAGMGGNLEELSLKADKFSEMITNIGNSSGTSSSIVAGYANDLMTIPGALDNFNGAADKTVKGFNFLDATMKVATGTGMGMKNTIDIMENSYLKFGTTGKIVLENISAISNASNTLKIPLQMLSGTVKELGDKFENFGDNTQGALKILGSLGPALQQSGLGPSAVNKLFSGVIDGIKDMDVAKKAFLSGQTGGPGGLQGAFQIDLELRKGNTDAVFNKMKESLQKQFGGSIVSLDQAAGDQSAAAQYQKQIMMVKNSGIAKDDAGAQRILEALSKNDISGLGDQLKTPQEAMVQSMERGEKIQARQFDVLTMINNNLSRVAAVRDINADNNRRDLTGAVSNYTGRMRIDAQAAADKTRFIGGRATDNGKSVEENSALFLSSGKEKINELFGTMKNKLTSKIIEGFPEGALKKSAMKNLGLNEGMKKTTEKDVERSSAQGQNQAQGKDMSPMQVVVKVKCADCGKKATQELIDENNSGEQRKARTGTRR